MVSSLLFFAITEQLVANNHGDVRKAADTLQELAKQIERERFRTWIQDQIDDVAERLGDVTAPTSAMNMKPRLVVSRTLDGVFD